jgi:hypothetical protein
MSGSELLESSSRMGFWQRTTTDSSTLRPKCLTRQSTIAEWRAPIGDMSMTSPSMNSNRSMDESIPASAMR